MQAASKQKPVTYGMYALSMHFTILPMLEQEDYQLHIAL